MQKFLVLLVIFTSLILASCGTSTKKRQTLGDIDVVGNYSAQKRTSIDPKNEKQIRKAYIDYLEHAAKGDTARIDALQRLAQLEFELTESASINADTENTLKIEDQIHDATLNRTIELLETSLRDYPKSPATDVTLYQLAKVYDQKGLHDKSIVTLENIIQNFSTSKYYVESLFRLAEEYFSKRDYTKAEDIYTEVLVTKDNKLFRDKARYKRGWARYKQEFYLEAIDDFVLVINHRNFLDYEKLKNSTKNEFEEYFRALGLSFSYTGGSTALNEYFKTHTNFKQVYYAYLYTSNIYLSQERYNDAVFTLTSYSRHHPNSPYLPLAGLKVIDIWKDSGFTKNVVNSLETFYNKFHPQNEYWSSKKTKAYIYKTTRIALKNYLILAASHYHKEYQNNKKEADFIKSNNWYQRYLAHFNSYSKKDNIHLLYAQLLNQHKDYSKSLHHYELAAYDGEIILNKDAAYSSVLLTSKLHKLNKDPEKNQAYLDKLVSYSLLFARLYPNDARSMKVMTHASQQAYLAKKYDNVINLTEIFTDIPYTKQTYNINVIKAHSYFKLKQYEDAENSYQAILERYKLSKKSKKHMQDNLATSIYNQATAAKALGNDDLAVRHFTRITNIAPSSGVAATGLYDAIALTIDRKKWNDAIVYIKLFQAKYPTSSLNRDVSKKLSVAYLNSDQDIAAATELVKISRNENNADYKIAALWKAGELYESKNDYRKAVSTFEEYAKLYRRPYPQYMESMQKLTDLYVRTNNNKRAIYWRKTILNADKRTPGNVKTERTKFITSKAALNLATIEHSKFKRLKLTLPLKRSLKRKKLAMQKSVNLYGRASSYGVLETTTQATFNIAEIYYTFSTALLDSDRPKSLNETELEQYSILLEDQAIPFEEKAIEFYETNLSHTKEGIYDDWLKKSHTRLKELFPSRYKRQPKLEPFINVLH